MSLLSRKGWMWCLVGPGAVLGLFLLFDSNTGQNDVQPLQRYEGHQLVPIILMQDFLHPACPPRQNWLGKKQITAPQNPPKGPQENSACIAQTQHATARKKCKTLQKYSTKKQGIPKGRQKRPRATESSNPPWSESLSPIRKDDGDIH